MEWVVAIVIIMIAFVPIVHRINQRIDHIEKKIDQIEQEASTEGKVNF